MNIAKRPYLVALFLVVFLCGFFTTSHKAHAVYAGGTGTSVDPYHIATCNDILDMDNHLSASFVLDTDVDCSGAGDNAMVEGVFTGALDGYGHTITLAIDTTDSGVGLFQELSGSYIKNLHLSGSIKASGIEGAVAGTANWSSVIQYVGSDVTMTSYPGANTTGGLVGILTNSSRILNSYSSGDVSANGYGVGGLVGIMFSGASIDRSYYSGTVTGGTDTGGLVGKGDTGSGAVIRSFVAGHVSGGVNTGTFMGEKLVATLVNDYFDADIGGLGAVCSADDANACTAVNIGGSAPDYFFNDNTNAPLPEWDFVNVWQANVGAAPTLRTPVLSSSAYYPLDDVSSGLTPDFSEVSQNAALYGSPVPVKVIGRYQHALSFNGSNYAATTVGFTPNGTVSAWVYPTAASDWQSPVGWKSAGNGYVLFDTGNAGMWRAVFNPDSNQTETSITDSNAITLNTWHHLLMTWSLDPGTSTYTITFYVDGVSVGANTWTGTPSANGIGGLNIGRGGDFDDNYFTGKIDEVRIYDQVLGSTQLNALMSAVSDPSSGIPVVTASSPNSDVGITVHQPTGIFVFSEAMDPGSISVSISPCDESCPTTALNWSNDYVLSFVIDTPDPLHELTDYTLEVNGQSREGIPMAGPYYMTFTTADLTTQTPIFEILAPTSGGTYKTNEAMQLAFTLPEDMFTGTLAVTFTRTDAEADPIIIHLRDAESGHVNPFTLSLDNISGATEVTSATANSIPAGTYIVALSYQDAHENQTASAAIPDIVIAEPVASTGGGVVVPLPTSYSVGSSGPVATSSNQINLPGDCLPGFAFSPSTGKACGIHQNQTPVTEQKPFPKDLRKGMDDPDVARLQHYLNTHGFAVATSGWGSLGQEATTFGGKTVQALVKFQKANNIVPASGFFGPKTRAFVNAHL